MGAPEQHPRLIIHNFLSLDECKELEFIHKSSSTVGYRSNVFSTTLSHLIATNSANLIMPIIPIRERLKEKAEEFFGCDYELFIEFTGLISWCRGASIGWHSDDNRPYLRQREFAVVCYLNSYEKDFSGGLFHFQDGDPTTITPRIGDALMYTADSRNIHSVDEITDGERLTLTLWFTRDDSHDEDVKIISFLSQKQWHDKMPNLWLPVPASNNMYWFPDDQTPGHRQGFNICLARLHALGFDVHLSQDDHTDISELMIVPAQLVWGNKMFDQEFANILHALQVVQFYYWKAFSSSEVNISTKRVIDVTQSLRDRIHGIKRSFLLDHELVEKIFCCMNCEEELNCFDWNRFSTAYVAWEEYSRELSKLIASSLPYWIHHQSLYLVPLEVCQDQHTS